MRKMTTFLKLSALGALFLGVAGFYSCTPPTEEETLAAPTNAKVTKITSVGATLTWYAVDGAEFYEIRGPGITQESVSGTSKVLTTLEPEEEYTWEVRAGKGESLFSDWTPGEPFTTIAPTIPAPTALDDTNLTPTSVTLTWTAAADVDSYLLVFTGDNSHGETPISLTETTKSFTDLTPGVTYTWSVQSVKGTWKSDVIDGNNITTPTLGSPTNARAENVLMDKATLTWGSVEFATGYRIKGENINGGVEISVTGNSYTIEGLAPNTDYTWQVQSSLGDYFSEWANGTPFKTATAVTPLPTDLTYTQVTYNSAVLSWQHADAEKHEVRLNDGTGFGEPIAVTGLTYTATGLEADTPYTWQVHSFKDGVWSDWATGPQFTTKEIRYTLTYPYGTYLGDIIGSGTTGAFMIELLDFDPSGIWNGRYIYMLALAPLSSIDGGSDKYFVDIPAGTYTVSDSAQANTVLAGVNAGLDIYEDDEPLAELSITSGTLVISGNRSNYTIKIDVYLSDGTQFHADYVGPMNIINDNFVLSYETLLGPYTGRGSAMSTQQPGAPTWTGVIGQPSDGSRDYYVISGNFDGDVNTLMGYRDGRIYLDNNTTVATANHPDLGPMDLVMDAAFLYGDADANGGNGDGIIGDDDDYIMFLLGNTYKNELPYDTETQTITFPKQLNFGGDYGLRTMLYGIGAWSPADSTGEREDWYGRWSEYYSDFVMTLGGANAGTFKGTRVNVNDKRLKSTNVRVQSIPTGTVNGRVLRKSPDVYVPYSVSTVFAK